MSEIELGEMCIHSMYTLVHQRVAKYLYRLVDIPFVQSYAIEILPIVRHQHIVEREDRIVKVHAHFKIRDLHQPRQLRRRNICEVEGGMPLYAFIKILLLQQVIHIVDRETELFIKAAVVDTYHYLSIKGYKKMTGFSVVGDKACRGCKCRIAIPALRYKVAERQKPLQGDYMQRIGGSFHGWQINNPLRILEKILFMPVRIDNTSDPASFTVSADKLQSGMVNFHSHYYLLGGNSDFIADFSLNWNDFQAIVDNYKLQYPGVPESDIALRFIHSYDPNDNALFLKLQFCQMQLTTITEYNSQVYQLLSNNNELWYVLREGAAFPDNPGTLLDQVYLDSFEYKPVPTEALAEQLSQDGGLKFVRTLTFPWLSEIYQMYQDNGAPQDPPDTVLLKFASCSYTELEPGSSSVLWPHGLVLYLNVNGTDLLDNENSVAIFHYKGADLSAQCPPRCNMYATPPPTM